MSIRFLPTVTTPFRLICCGSEYAGGSNQWKLMKKLKPTSQRGKVTGGRKRLRASRRDFLSKTKKRNGRQSTLGAESDDSPKRNARSGGRSSNSKKGEVGLG